jgi:hypothetical protein
MQIYIKNMVCKRTKFFVLQELERLDLNYSSFEFGAIDVKEDLSLTKIRKLDNALRKYGLELMFRNSKLVSRIHEVVLDLVRNNITQKVNFSAYVSQNVGYNYTYLNEYYRKETGLPIEEYYIKKKIEKEKLDEHTWSDGFNHFKKSA